jgi:oligopeptide transport system ATP-binding protein
MESLLDVRNLAVHFHTRNGLVKAVDGISFKVEASKTTAIIGESGSGKSVACYSLIGLIPKPPAKVESGSAEFDGKDLIKLSEKELRKVRGKGISIIFQDPMTSLNPFLKVGTQLIEPLCLHFGMTKKDAWEKATSVLEEVGIKDAAKRMNSWPFEFSGGMRQRVVIAMALITEPKIIIADEPTTALDVTVQAQILKLLKDLQKKRQIGVLFISHDLSVVADFADDIAVMKDGKFVEQGSREDLFQRPQHEYTKKLLNAVPTAQKPPNERSTSPLLVVNNLNTQFSSNTSGEIIKAVQDVSFSIGRNEIVGLVGESGSGKSTLGRSVMRLVRPHSGSVLFDGIEMTEIEGKNLKNERRRMQMIFQDPYASLNPRMSVYDALAEPILLHKIADKKGLDKEVFRLMGSVGLARESVLRYPHEFSGGQRQRIAIGRAIATKPEFIVADEAVSALDVTIQAQILDLLLELVSEFDLTMLFISHDLGVVRYLVDRILVMNEGRLVESGTTEAVLNNPQQIYTQTLLKAIPGKSLMQNNLILS